MKEGQVSYKNVSLLLQLAHYFSIPPLFTGVSVDPIFEQCTYSMVLIYLKFVVGGYIMIMISAIVLSFPIPIYVYKKVPSTPRGINLFSSRIISLQ